MNKIGFIGCGTMGKLMALNLIKSGFSVVVYDLNSEAVQYLVEKGATKANSPIETAKLVDLVITMLPTSSNVEDVMLGPEGVIEGLKKGSIIIDMSTINPVVTRNIAQIASEKGIEMIDSPVGGSSKMAEDGTLPLFVGGKKEVLEKCRNVLEVIGKEIIYVGDIGMGEVVKLANNLMAAVYMIGICEAILFGEKFGADPKILFDVMSSSAAKVLWTKFPRPGIVEGSPADYDFAPGFTSDLMIKDLGLAQSASDSIKLPLIACNLTRELIKGSAACGYSKKDWTAVIKYLGKLSGDE